MLPITTGVLGRVDAAKFKPKDSDGNRNDISRTWSMMPRVLTIIVKWSFVHRLD